MCEVVLILLLSLFTVVTSLIRGGSLIDWLTGCHELKVYVRGNMDVPIVHRFRQYLDKK